MRKIIFIISLVLLGAPAGFAEDAPRTPAIRAVVDKPKDITSLLFAPQVVLPIELTLRETVESQGEPITLGQISECRGEQQACREAYGIVLGEAPVPGRKITLSRDKISALLALEWPERSISFNGAAEVKISASGQSLTTQQVSLSLEEALADINDKQSKVRLGFTRLTLRGEGRMRPSPCKIIIDEVQDIGTRSLDWVLAKLVGHQNLRARCVYENTEIEDSSFQISAEFHLQLLLPVAKYDLPRGATVASADFAEEWVSIGQGHQGLVKDISGVEGQILARALPVGKPLSRRQLVARPAVVRGQMVKLSLTRGGLLVTGQVKALENGARGAFIDALLTKTKKKLRVRVLDQDNVELALNDP